MAAECRIGGIYPKELQSSNLTTSLNSLSIIYAGNTNMAKTKEADCLIDNTFQAKLTTVTD